MFSSDIFLPPFSCQTHDAQTQDEMYDNSAYSVLSVAKSSAITIARGTGSSAKRPTIRFDLSSYTPTGAPVVHFVKSCGSRCTWL